MWAATLLVIPRHGWNSSNNGEVPSLYIRLCLFTISMFCFENKAVKDFSCLVLHSVIQNKMIQHSNTTKKSCNKPFTWEYFVATSWSSHEWRFRFIKHASCNITCELIPGSPPPFYFHQSEGRSWEQGYPLPSPISKYTIVQGTPCMHSLIE